jgi:hypothetical protein
MRHPITITIDPDIWKMFQEICGELRLTPSREIQFLIEQWIRERERQKRASKPPRAAVGGH